MRTVAEIDADIANVKAEMKDVHGSTTEVYARIVGYYRSVRNWNPGKREEYKHRKIFIADEKGILEHLPELCDCVPAAGTAEIKAEASTISRYELFIRKSCPNCPPVKDACAQLQIAGEHIDVDSNEGFARASAYGVFSAPTVIFFDAFGTELNRAHTANEIKAVLSSAYAEENVLCAVV